jgi:hypothetical protein
MAWPWRRQSEDAHEFVLATAQEIPVARHFVALSKTQCAIADPFETQPVEVVEKATTQTLLLQYRERRKRENAQPRKGDEETLPETNPDKHSCYRPQDPAGTSMMTWAIRDGLGSIVSG